LRERLRRSEDAAPAKRSPLPWRLNPALGALAAVIAVVLLFTIPSVRASAQAFLDLFRVRNFAVVQVDQARLDRIRELHTQAGRDPGMILFDDVEKVKDPGEPRVFTDPVAAGQAAGFQALVPATIPGGMRADTILVQGETEARMTVNGAKLRSLLTSLGIDDVTVPPQLDGTRVTAHMSPALCVRYRGDRSQAALIQARSPEVSLPQGLDLPQIGEIGLRIVGLSAAEAHRFAQSIDWHTTLLVPVPTNASSFREVSVRGHKGLLVSTTGEGNIHHPRRGSVLLWSEGDMVYALSGTLDEMNLMQMANSLR